MRGGYGKAGLGSCSRLADILESAEYYRTKGNGTKPHTTKFYGFCGSRVRFRTLFRTQKAVKFLIAGKTQWIPKRYVATYKEWLFIAKWFVDKETPKSLRDLAALEDGKPRIFRFQVK